MNTRALNWLLWHFVLDWSGEKLGGLAAVGWGTWVTLFRPLADSPGWHYLVWLASCQNVLPADLCFGPAVVLVGVRQLALACRPFELTAARLNHAILGGCLFAFFAFALILGQPTTTGVPIYSLLAWQGFATYYQLAFRARGRMPRP